MGGVDNAVGFLIGPPHHLGFADQPVLLGKAFVDAALVLFITRIDHALGLRLGPG